jgi:myo-inositol-1(or 4)-monophosphatase
LDSLVQPVSVSTKARDELVTGIGVEIEDRLVQEIAASLYNYPVQGEEINQAINLLDLPEGWSVDPDDGSINLFHGFPHVSTSIGLVRHGKVVVGVVCALHSGDLFWAEKGQGAYLNGKLIKVSSIRDLKQALVCIDWVADNEVEAERGRKLYNRLAPPVSQAIRQTASCSLDLCFVAAGWYDAYVCAYPPLRTPPCWDHAAGSLVLSEASGRLTGFGPEEWSPQLINRLATNGHLHDSLGELVRDI